MTTSNTHYTHNHKSTQGNGLIEGLKKSEEYKVFNKSVREIYHNGKRIMVVTKHKVMKVVK